MIQATEAGTGPAVSTPETNGVEQAPPPPPAESKPSLPPITDDDEDDNIPLGQLAGRTASNPTPTTPTTPTTTSTTKTAQPAATTPKPAATTPKPAAKPAANTPKPAASSVKPAAATGKPAASPSTAKPAATTSKPAASPAKPAGTAKPAAATPKPAAGAAKLPPKPAASPAKPTASTAPAANATANGDKVEKTTDTKIETTTTPKDTKSTTTTVTTTTTTTPTAASKVTVTNTLTTTTPTKTDDSDDDKPLSSLVSEKKVAVIKKEKKDDEIVTTSKTTTVKKEVKDSAKKEVKKAVKKETPKKAPKRKAESSSDDEKPKKKATKKKKVESDSDASDDEPKKKAKAKAKAKPKKEVKEEGGEKKKGKKKEGEGEGEEEWKWWEEEALPDGKKWTSLVHNGVMFAEPYVPHGVKFYYDGKPINLSSEAEEVATFYAKYLETDYPKKENFNSNFWKEFRTYLTPEQAKVIKDFTKADFTHIHKYLVEQKELKANRTPEEKKAEKAEKEKLIQKYGFAMINGHRQRISNWALERPGLFLGRGAHPKTGLVKKRIEAEDITINIGKGVPVPEPPPGHKWCKVVHDDKVAWLAMWKENVNNGFKYVWLHASSAVKGRSDMKKFEVARKLKDHIGTIRKKYIKELSSDELEERQRATAIYLIDRLALRVGNEKDEDTADTVGCCSLRVEHVTLKEPASVTLDFLGKDSMRYHNTVDVDPKVFKNLSEFMYKGGNKKTPKKPENDLFDQLETTSLNRYLKGFMENLSAKVFRTYNASLTLEKELAKMPVSLMNATADEKVLFYNRCNREVAILCNHQRSLSKTHTETMGKIDEKIAEFEHKKEKLQQQMAYLKGKGKKPVLSDSESDDEDEDTPKKATPKKATPKKATPKKETDSKDEATPKKRKKDDEDAADDFKETPKKKVKRALPDTVDKCKAAIERVDASINKWNIKKTEKDELKSVALTTSKINYIDPRITAAWAKRVNLDIGKLFSKSLREKFPWAMDVEEDWEF